MATIQQSIEVRVPAQAAFNQLMQFENYPQFMGDVDAVEQVDSTHLHWTTRMANRPVEWDAEITEQEPGRCIAWHNTSGPTNAGKVEVTPLGPDAAQVSITLQTEPQQVPGSMTAYSEGDMQARLRQDMMRFKEFMESGAGQQAGQLSHGSAGMTDKVHAQQGVWRDDNATGAIAGTAGGTDASAGAQLSGSKGRPGGQSLRESGDAAGVPGTPGGMVRADQVSPAAGAEAAGGTGLGSAASADDTSTGTGTSSGSGTSLTGGGQSGGRDAGIGSPTRR